MLAVHCIPLVNTELRPFNSEITKTSNCVYFSNWLPHSPGLLWFGTHSLAEPTLCGISESLPPSKDLQDMSLWCAGTKAVTGCRHKHMLEKQ